MWMQSNIAWWKWIPKYTRIPGAVFPDEKKYRPSYANFCWGCWVWAWEVHLFPFDSMSEGTETVVNTHSCVVRHWDWKPFRISQMWRSRKG